VTPWDDGIQQLKRDALFRELTLRTPGPRFSDGDRLVTNFATNDYLGLTQDDRVKAAALEAIRRFGTGSGSSRLLGGHFAVHEALESLLAEWKGTEKALVFSSGYAANVGVLTALTGSDDGIFSDALNHASIIDGCRLSRATVRVYPHGDIDYLASLLAKTPLKGRRFIVSDGVFSMDGDIAPLRQLIELVERFDAWLVVDDAHGHGVVGRFGRGVVDALDIHHERVVQVGTLSKALASQGGFVTGSRALIDWIVNSARSFIFSTGLAPAAAAAAMKAVDIIRTEPSRQTRLQQYITQVLTALGRPLPRVPTPIIPLLAGTADRALHIAGALWEEGVWAPAIRPPTVPVGTSRIRISLSAAHQPAEIDTLVEVLKRLGMGGNSVDGITG